MLEELRHLVINRTVVVNVHECTQEVMVREVALLRNEFDKLQLGEKRGTHLQLVNKCRRN